MLLAQGEKGRGASALRWRCRTSAADTDRVALAWGRRQDLLKAELVAPGDVEVVRVEGALADPKAEIDEADGVRVIGEAGSADVADAVNEELVQIVVTPAEGELDDGVKLGDGGCVA
jgi:hypothetical protein